MICTLYQINTILILILIIIAALFPQGSDGVFGTPGAGAQIAKCDPSHKLGMAYLTNHMTCYGYGDDPRFLELERLSIKL